MSLLDVLGSRAQRSIADARHNVARLGRTIVTFSGSKIVFTASPSPDGQKQLTTAASNGNGSSANGSPVKGSAPRVPSGNGSAATAAVANGSSKKPDAAVKVSPPQNGAKSVPAGSAGDAPAPEPAKARSNVATMSPPEVVAPPAATKSPSTAGSSLKPQPATASSRPAPQPVKPPPILRPTSVSNGNAAVRASQPIFGPPVPPDENSPPFVRREWRRRNPDHLLQATNRLNWIAAAVVVIGLLNVAGLYYALHLTGNALNVAANVTSNQTVAVKTEQRAWIAPGSISLQAPFNRTHIGMTVALNNTGKTPATIDGVDIAVDAYDPRSNRRSPILERHIPSHTLAPSSHLSLPINEVKPISSGDFQRILSRGVRHEFIVTVRYRDIFGDAHRTNFCNAVEGSAAEMSYGNTMSSCDPNTMD